MEEYRLGVVLLGLPLEKSENGYIAVETGVLRADLRVETCTGREARVEAPPPASGMIAGFARRMLEELGLDACIAGSLEASGQATPASLYAAGTVAVFRAVARHYGEEPRVYEVLEYSSMLDDQVHLPWQGAISTLRLLSLEGGAVVYRNLDEYAKLDDAPRIPAITLRGEHRVGTQKYNDEDLGPDLYGALIHTVGVLVLEGAVRLREGSTLTPLLALQRSIASYLWDYRGEGYPSPGLPGTFYEISEG